MKKVYEVTSYIELDLEDIIHHLKVMNDDDMTADDVIEYISNHLIRLKPTGGSRGIYAASDGPSINGFADKTYFTIQEMLEDED